MHHLSALAPPPSQPPLATSLALATMAPSDEPLAVAEAAPTNTGYWDDDIHFTHGGPARPIWPWLHSSEKVRKEDANAMLKRLQAEYAWHKHMLHQALQTPVRDKNFHQKWQERLWKSLHWHPEGIVGLGVDVWQREADLPEGLLTLDDIVPCYYSVLADTNLARNDIHIAHLFLAIEQQEEVFELECPPGDVLARTAFALMYILYGEEEAKKWTSVAVSYNVIDFGYQRDRFLKIWPDKLTLTMLRTALPKVDPDMTLGVRSETVMSLTTSMCATASMEDQKKLHAVNHWLRWMQEGEDRKKKIKLLCFDSQEENEPNDVILLARLLEKLVSILSVVPGSHESGRAGASAVGTADLHARLVNHIPVGPLTHLENAEYAVGKVRDKVSSTLPDHRCTPEQFKKNVDKENLPAECKNYYPWPDQQPNDNNAVEIALAMIEDCAKSWTKAKWGSRKRFEKSFEKYIARLFKKASAFVLLELKCSSVQMEYFYTKEPAVRVGKGFARMVRAGVPIGPLNPDNDVKTDCALMAMNHALGFNMWPMENDKILHGPMDRDEVIRHLDATIGQHGLNLVQAVKHNMTGFNVLNLRQGIHILFCECFTADDQQELHAMMYDANRSLLVLGQLCNKSSEIARVEDSDRGVHVDDAFNKFCQRATNMQQCNVINAIELFVNTQLLNDFEGSLRMRYDPTLPAEPDPKPQTRLVLKRRDTVPHLSGQGRTRRGKRRRSSKKTEILPTKGTLDAHDKIASVTLPLTDET